MEAKEIAVKYTKCQHDALTDIQEVKDLEKDITEYLRKHLNNFVIERECCYGDTHDIKIIEGEVDEYLNKIITYFKYKNTIFVE